MESFSTSNIRSEPDQVLIDIARYVTDYVIDSQEAYKTARYCLLDALGCGFLALRYPECTKLLGPLIPGTTVPHGATVPGSQFRLDPVQAAFNIGCIIRYLDFNDTWLAAEWGHPSDNLGGILASADYISRLKVTRGESPLTMTEVLTALIKAYEIQGVLALENSFNRVGLDHVLLVKVASTAVVTHLLGGHQTEIINAVSNAWLDNAALRTYRQAPNTGSRKSWAAGDATSRAVWLALMTLKGEMGYPSVLTAKNWGFYDVLFKGQPFTFQRPYGTYVVENILFKIAFPAEFHAQTAVEAALALREQINDWIEMIDRVVITTHESAIRIIDKTGPLHNPADRDHCLQYMVAIALLYGELTSEHYEDHIAGDPRIDTLRAKMIVEEDRQYSQDYHAPDKRSIANAVQVFFKDDSCTDRVAIEYPLGHRRRRAEGMPLLMEKFATNLATRFPAKQVKTIMTVCQDPARLAATPVPQFMDMFVI